MADTSAGRAAIWNPKLARLIVYGKFTGAPTFSTAYPSQSVTAAPPIRVGTTDVP